MLTQHSINDEIVNMRQMAQLLVPHSFPLRPPQEEDDITVLKQRDLTLDGYEMIAYHSQAIYGNIRLETLQIYGKWATFLPFRVVCKMAKFVLGENELGLVEMMHHRNGAVDEFARKIYVWKVYYSPDGPIPNPFVTQRKSCVFEGLHYCLVPQNQIAFF